jgi:hypothetical protein
MANDSISNRITELHNLFKAGAIDKAEFESLKAKILHKNIDATSEEKFLQNSNSTKDVPDTSGYKEDGENELISGFEGKKKVKLKKNKAIVIISLLVILGLLILAYFLTNSFSNFSLLKASDNEYFKDSLEIAIRRKAFDSIQANYDNSGESASAIERYILPFYNQDVKRDKERLILNLDNGKQKIYTNFVVEERTNEWKKYYFYDFYKRINAYFILIEHYEGCGYMLLNKSDGFSIDIKGIPMFSPKMDRFIVTTSTGEDSDEGIWIYRAENNQYTKEYEEMPKDWAISKVEWVNNDKIRIIKAVLKDNRYVPGSSFYLDYEKNQWIKNIAESKKNEEPKTIAEEPLNIISVAASSSLNQSGNLSYYPSNATDHNLQSWWTPSPPHSDGYNSWLRIDFGQTVKVIAIEIHNGSHYPNYGKYGDLYFKNNRLLKATLEFSNGTTQTIKLREVDEIQRIPIQPQNTTYLKLLPLEWARGSQWNDLCISEFAAIGE